MTADLPTDVRRVLARWDPDSLTRLTGSSARADAVALLVAPGLPRTDLETALAAQGLSLTDAASASAVGVVLDPSLPIGRTLTESIRAIPIDTPVVVAVPTVDAAVAARVVADAAAFAPRLAAAPTVVDVDAGRVAVDIVRAAGRTDRTAATRQAVQHALLTARSALAKAGREDPGAADLAELRDRRNRVPTAVDDAAAMRRRVAEVRLDLAHRVGVHRRDTAARVTDAVTTARGRDLRRVPAAVAAEVLATSQRLSREVSGALDCLGETGVSGGAPFGTSTTDQPPPTGRRSVEDVLAGVIGASAGAGVGRVVSWAVSLGGTASMIAVVVGAALMSAAVVRTRTISADRARLRRWATEVVADAAATWDHDVASRVLAVEAALGARMAARARDASARRDARIAEIDREIREVAAAASRRAASYQRDLDVLERALDAHPIREGTAGAAGASNEQSGVP